MKSNSQKFWKNVSATMYVPFIIYADIEAITLKIEKSVDNSRTRKHEKQVPRGIRAVSLNEEGALNKEFFNRGEKCVSAFLFTMSQWAEDIYKDKRKYPINRKKDGDEHFLMQATERYLCSKVLGTDRVFGHNHVNGELRGRAHQTCNGSCRTTNFTSVVFHNGSKYNFKQILRNYQPADKDEKLECIANNSEKFLSFSTCVPTNTFRNKNNETKIVYEKLKFIDSFRFQSRSLGNPIQTMKADDLPFPTSDYSLRGFSKEQQQLIFQKGI